MALSRQKSVTLSWDVAGSSRLRHRTEAVTNSNLEEMFYNITILVAVKAFVFLLANGRPIAPLDS